MPRSVSKSKAPKPAAEAPAPPAGVAGATAAAPAKPAATAGGYEVARPSGKCAVTGEVIAPDDKYMAALRETPTGMERVDVSLGAWKDFDRSGLLASWQTVMPRPEAKKKVFVDDEVLATLFERLADTTEPAKVNFRFVLGLILMRKRLIQYESSKTVDGQDVWVVKPRGRDDRLEMVNPKLDELQVAEVSTQLGEILNSEL